MNPRSILRFALGAFSALATQLSAQTIEVTSTGVGIGTTTPSYKFEVLDTAAANGVISRWTRNSKSFEIYTGSMVDIQLGTPTNSSLGFYTNNSAPLLTLSTGQKVGIGTTSPTRTLEVAGQIYSNVPGGGSLELAGNNSNSQPGIYFSRSSGAVWVAGLTGDASASLYFNNGYGGGNVMTMTPAGNVGIGTASPGYKLEVSGSVRASSFVANSNTYADFVFDDDYKLASLSEVETAIKKQKHLTGIPSAAEAKERGVDVGEMQVKLLQKVEELTLYLVAHDKELKSLRAENEALRQQLSQTAKP